MVVGNIFLRKKLINKYAREKLNGGELANRALLKYITREENNKKIERWVLD